MSHTCFRIALSGRPRWYVKRADPRRTQGRDLGVEAVAYQLAAFEPRLQAVMPRCVLIGENGNAVVLEAAEGEPLSSRLSETNGTLTNALLRASGEALAQVHKIHCAPFGTPPWLLTALEPQWGGYTWLPRPAASLLSRLAASAAFQQGFLQARREWKTVCLVHGDMRWSNLLASGNHGDGSVKLIDWELACVGDPAWDLGGLLSEVVASASVTVPLEPSLEHLGPRCRPLLGGYRDALQPEAAGWSALLERSIRLAGIRLVQTVIEYAHASPADAAQAERAFMPWSGWFLAHAQRATVALADAVDDPATA